MSEEVLSADIVVIGAGIAGLSVAYHAVRRGYSVVVLDRGLSGTTQSATGLIAPRSDYLLEDLPLVAESASACLLLQKLFPDLIRMTPFVIPIGPNMPYPRRVIEGLIAYYEMLTSRMLARPPYQFISGTHLSDLEPALRPGYFTGAFVVHELAVDAAMLLGVLRRNISGAGAAIVPVGPVFEAHVGGRTVQALHVTGSRTGTMIKIRGRSRPLSIVNATGPWLAETARQFGIDLDIRLYRGTQMLVPGVPFRNNIISFSPDDGKYVIHLRHGQTLQVGPTNIAAGSHPIGGYDRREIEYLRNALRELTGKTIPGYEHAKVGWRVKLPGGIDRNRPVFWHHAKDGITNLHSFHPGKLSLALAGASELLNLMSNKHAGRIFSIDGHDPGNRQTYYGVRLASGIRTGAHVLKFLISGKA